MAMYELCRRSQSAGRKALRALNLRTARAVIKCSASSLCQRNASQSELAHDNNARRNRRRRARARACLLLKTRVENPHTSRVDTEATPRDPPGRSAQNDPDKLRRLRHSTGPRRAAVCAVQNEILRFDLPTRPLAPRPQADLQENTPWRQRGTILRRRKI